MNGMKIWQDIEIQNSTFTIICAIIIGLETDILFRVFLLVPGQMYWVLYGLSVSGLQLIWLSAGFVTPFKVLLATIIGVTIMRPLLNVIRYNQI